MSDKTPLNVLHVSTWDNAGGSGRAAYRLHTGLKRLGVVSRMLVGKKRTNDPDVRVLGGAWSRLNQWCGLMGDALDFQYLSYPAAAWIPRMRWFQEADVVQIFNTHGGYFSSWGFIPLSQRKPVVWRLSDMWAFTGHCSYAYECDRWKTGCGQCPHLDEYPRLRWDRSDYLWKVKQAIYQRSAMTIVAPSRWMANLVQQSPLLNRFPLQCIPNGLDTEIFRPIPKSLARQKLGLDLESQWILFSAASLQEERKGGRFLKQALQRLAANGLGKVRLLVMGQGAGKWNSDGLPVHAMGEIRDDHQLASVYSAADLFALPTLADNLPNGILESMACGTPVVSFNVGGIPEVIQHMDTGYLAKPQDARDLAVGMQRLLELEDQRKQMAARCRAKIVQEYTLELQAQRFKNLYESLKSENVQSLDSTRLLSSIRRG